MRYNKKLGILFRRMPPMGKIFSYSYLVYEAWTNSEEVLILGGKKIIFSYAGKKDYNKLIDYLIISTDYEYIKI